MYSKAAIKRYIDKAIERELSLVKESKKTKDNPVAKRQCKNSTRDEAISKVVSHCERVLKQLKKIQKH